MWPVRTSVACRILACFVLSQPQGNNEADESRKERSSQDAKFHCVQGAHYANRKWCAGKDKKRHPGLERGSPEKWKLDRPRVSHCRHRRSSAAQAPRREQSEADVRRRVRQESRRSRNSLISKFVTLTW
jgi:hypothetical protein